MSEKQDAKLGDPPVSKLRQAPAGFSQVHKIRPLGDRSPGAKSNPVVERSRRVTARPHADWRLAAVGGGALVLVGMLLRGSNGPLPVAHGQPSVVDEPGGSKRPVLVRVEVAPQMLPRLSAALDSLSPSPALAGGKLIYAVSMSPAALAQGDGNQDAAEGSVLNKQKPGNTAHAGELDGNKPRTNEGENAKGGKAKGTSAEGEAALNNKTTDTASPGSATERQSFFVLREMDAAGKPGAAVAYRVQGAVDAFDPQFSPDGSLVVFKAANPLRREGSYWLYIWNRKTNQVQLGPDQPGIYNSVFWSPDSHAIAYVQAATGQSLTGGPRPRSANWPGATPHLVLSLYDLWADKTRAIATDSAAVSPAWTMQDALLFSKAPSPPTTPASAPSRGEQPINRPRDKNPGTASSTEIHGRSDIYPAGVPGLVSRPIGLPPGNPAFGNLAPGQSRPEIRQVPAARPLLPDLYEIAAAAQNPSQQQRLVARQAYHPVPAPDGQWLAFFGAPDPTVEMRSGPSICLLQRGSNIRHVVRDRFSDFLWTPDSKRLLLLKTMLNGTTAQAQVASFEVATQQQRQVAAIQPPALPAGAPPLATTTPAQFRPLSVSPDGKLLFLEIRQTAAPPATTPNSPASELWSTVEAINLEEGAVSTVCHLRNVVGYHWLMPSKTKTSVSRTARANH